MTKKKILILIFVVAFLTLLIGCLPGLTPPPPKGVISGRIMVPSSETTKDITGWIPVANATVTLTDSSGITHTVTTDEDGYYTFTNIAVNANTIITATAVIDGNTVIVKDVIPQAVAADEDYNAKTADAESTALALIVEELLEQGVDPEYINLEEIQDSDNFTEVVGQVTSVLEENGNVTIDPGVTNIVDYVAGDIIDPPAYTPPEEPPEPEPEPVILTYIVVLPVEMTLFVGESGTITSVTAHYSNGSTASIVLGNCTYASSASGIATVVAGEISALTPGTATITITYADMTDTLEVTVNSILLTSIVVDPKVMTLIGIEDTEDIKSVTAHYSDGSTKIVTSDCDYESSDTDVATVVAGEVIAEYYGEATITVTYIEEEITKTVYIEETDTIVVMVTGPVQNITQGTYYDTIQEAIDTADDGDTIVVAAGTYDETVELKINTASDISIIGQNKTTTFITGGICFAADYSGLKVQHFTISGNGLLGTDTYEATVSYWYQGGSHPLVTNLEFSDCIFDGEGYDDGEGGRCGIVLKRLGGVIKFENNEFKDYPGWAALDVNDGSGSGALLTVTSYTLINNDFLDNGGGCALRGNPNDYTNTVIVAGNTFDGPAGWAALEVNQAENVEIYDNEIRNVEVWWEWDEGQAIQLWKIGVADIYENIIENNYQGIAILSYPDTYDVSGISIYHNSFSGNDQYALSVEDELIGLPLNAEDNWWGNESGPVHYSITDGTGDIVIGNVYLYPYSENPNF